MTNNEMIKDIATAVSLCGEIKLPSFMHIEKEVWSIEHNKPMPQTINLSAIYKDCNGVLFLRSYKGGISYPLLECSNEFDTLLPELWKVCVNQNEKLTFEYCPHCEQEAIIPYKMAMGMCNHCGAPLAPCSYCSDNNDKQDCHHCPFNNAKHRNANIETETRIYIVDICNSHTTTDEVMGWSCEKFMEVAEEQGNVNTIDGLVQRYNIYNDLPKNGVMRIYDRPKRL
jgi:hypothetical protein